MPQDRHNFRGFTLLELVLVLAVMAIIAGMVAERLIGFAHGRDVANFADQVESLARFARNEAVARSTVYRLNFDGKARVVWVSEEDGPPDATVPKFISNSLAMQRAVPQDVGITFISTVDDTTNSDTTDVIRFYPDGRADPGSIKITSGDITIMLNCPSATESYRVAKAGT
jgi:type II secretion system protein H